MHRHQPGGVFHDRIVEREFAAIAQLHDADRGERLGDRSPVEDRVCVDLAAGGLVGHPVELARQHRVTPDEPERAAHYALAGQRGVEFLGHGLPGLGEVGGSLGGDRGGRRQRKPGKQKFSEHGCNLHPEKSTESKSKTVAAGTLYSMRRLSWIVVIGLLQGSSDTSAVAAVTRLIHEDVKASLAGDLDFVRKNSLERYREGTRPR